MLSFPDDELGLRRKPFAILRHLVQNPQRLATHAEIVEAVWGKIAMSESLLRTHVRDLRRVLGEGIIETVVGRGYRFVAELKHVYIGDPGLRASRAGTADAAKPVVGRDEELESLRDALGSASDQRRTTVFLTGEAGIGKTTLVDHFLEEASVRTTLLVGRGACVEQYGSGQAYLPVLDAIAALCRKGDRVIEIFSRHAPTWLVQMPALVRSEKLEELQRRAGGATQARTLRELAAALDELSSDAPVVIVLDASPFWPAAASPHASSCWGRTARRRSPAGTRSRASPGSSSRTGRLPRSSSKASGPKRSMRTSRSASKVIVFRPSSRPRWPERHAATHSSSRRSWTTSWHRSSSARATVAGSFRSPWTTSRLAAPRGSGASSTRKSIG